MKRLIRETEKPSFPAQCRVLAEAAVLVLCYNFLYFLIPYYGGYPVIYLIGFVLAKLFMMLA